MFPRRADFKPGLKISGVEIEHFSDIKIAYSTNGIGVSGILTGSVSFVTYGVYSDIFEWGAKVEISGAYGIPEFYISGREPEDKVIRWTAYDSLSKSDAPVEFTENEFKDGKISTFDVISKCAHVCGLINYGFSRNSITGAGIIGNIPRSLVEGKTAREILEMYSTALCGYWFQSDDTLVFSPFGSAARSFNITGDHEKISEGGSKKFLRIIMSDGDEVYTSGTADSKDTFMISSPLASAELCSYIADSLYNFTYKAWKCKKGFTDHFFYPGELIFSDGISRCCTNVTFNVTPAGLFFSASGNSVDENEYSYENQVKRELKKKIEFDAIAGNIQVSKSDGLVFVNKNKASAISTIAAGNGDKIEKFGFNVQDGGITEYDGAIVSKKDFSYAEMPDENTVILHYEDENIAYKYTFSESDGKISYTTEKITGGG